MVRSRAFTAALAAAFLTVAGCNSNSPPTDPAKVPPKADAEHGHKPTAHGGTVVPIGSDSYHAEAVFEKGGVLRLYTLGQDESKVLEVEAQPLNAFAKADGAAEAEAFTLAPRPQPGDKAGFTSLFVGQLPRDTVGKKVEVTIPAIRIGTERFRVAFKSAAETGDAHGMPAKVASDDEKKLYLTPGGKYTAADIKANGGVVASVKFKGLKAEHDAKPKPGDKLCPISMTKASAKFTWVVGGKSYEFCCPPCVDEFVQTAKDKPDEIKDPEAYRQK